MEDIFGLMLVALVRAIIISTFVLFAIFGGEPDLVDGIIYWLSGGGLK